MFKLINDVGQSLKGVSLQFSLTQALLLTLIVWSFIWKGIALWKSAGHKQKYWFILILIINTTGVLEIIYLLFFPKREKCILKSIQKCQSKETNQEDFLNSAII